jgi:hypothetical protein
MFEVAACGKEFRRWESLSEWPGTGPESPIGEVFLIEACMTNEIFV